MKIVVLLLAFTLSVCCISSADPGELDEKGGHYDQQTGNYHYHQQVTPPTEEDILSIQTGAIATAKRDAVSDAKQDSVWYGAGFLFGVFGVGAAYVITPSVPPERLLGKPAEYVIFYTDAYQKARQTEHIEQAAVGCALSSGLVLLYYLYSTRQL